jgi:hypothetical protein
MDIKDIIVNIRKQRKQRNAFQKFPTDNYPGRIYGMYDWDCDKNKWVINQDFCKENGIDIKE